MTLPQFDEFYVVSDLHLGGPPGSQIFTQGKSLAWLIDHIRNRPADRKVGLVLNGDVVDFLAEPQQVYFDFHNAATKLKRIFDDPAFSPVWEALENFVATAGRRLIFVLGNHDLELALPEVRETLLHRLCGDDAAQRGRITLALDGNGYGCRVGSADVLCLHGNEVDNWNVVDYFNLNEMIRAGNRRAAEPEWTANAGTRMVIDVMNDIKKTKQWVDLMKPEDKSLAALLIAHDPACASKIGKLFGISGRRFIDTMRMKLGFLSEEEQNDLQDEEYRLYETFLTKTFSSAGSEDMRDSGMEERFARMEDAFSRNCDPLGINAEEEFLGVGGGLIDIIAGRSAEKNMREALEAWRKADDRTFNPKSVDQTCDAIDKIAGSQIDYVIAGHTHLHRAIQRKNGHGYYYNSGTWINLIEITEEMLRDDAQYQTLWEALEDGSMSKLLNPGNGLQLIKEIRSVVSITRDGESDTVGRLQTVQGDNDETWRLVTVEQSEFRV